MLAVLKNPAYARLFSAQVVALLGTGLLTVALGLIAYDIAGEAAGQVLGLALTIKMLAYVFLGPVMAALTHRVKRKWVLIGADLVRAAAALLLPFIDATWQIYALIFVLQAASATFTPTFQATIPALFADEGHYTRALSLSRLAYDLESLLSPALAAFLLTMISYSGLFVGTSLGFVASALLIAITILPPREQDRPRPFRERVLRGSRIYLATPRLRGLLALNMAISAVGAVVIVQSVVIVRATYGLGEGDLAIALAATGAGSMCAALILPRLLDHLPDRAVMLTAGGAAAALVGALGLWVISVGWPAWPAFLLCWFFVGFTMAAIVTPSGRLLRRSSLETDRPALFAAQFALSHACWLIAYPMAGFIGAGFGLPTLMLIASAIAFVATGAAAWLWPGGAQRNLTHHHDDLPPGHPHLVDAHEEGGHLVHRHRFVIDDEHHAWPTNG